MNFAKPYAKKASRGSKKIDMATLIDQEIEERI